MLALVLIVIAFACFLAATVGASSRVNLVALGLAALTAAWLVERLHVG